MDQEKTRRNFSQKLPPPPKQKHIAVVPTAAFHGAALLRQALPALPPSPVTGDAQACTRRRS